MSWKPEVEAAESNPRKISIESLDSSSAENAFV
jgi:hypothetical protein